MALPRYFLGCPVWSFKEWTGELFTRDARPADFLRQYASVFKTVEGNTTFYGLPGEDTVAKWRMDTPDEFQFCFKFPRMITHDMRLQDAGTETEAFLERLTPLGTRLGPFLLQLPPSFSPANLPDLERYLDHLPDAHRYTVEVRHRAFFDGSPPEQRLNDLLRARGIDRAIFDTRALRTADTADPVVREAQRKKPDLPTRFFAIGPRPFFRFVAHPDVESNRPYLEHLADITAAWIEADHTPYVFMHSPYDFYAPQLGRLFHRLLRERTEVGDMPIWPSEAEEPVLEQLSLF